MTDSGQMIYHKKAALDVFARDGDNDLERMVALLDEIKIALRIAGANISRHEAAIDALVMDLQRSNGKKG
jgi:hypothetical protein